MWIKTITMAQDIKELYGPEENKNRVIPEVPKEQTQVID